MNSIYSFDLIPDVILRNIDPAKNVNNLIEDFNYNMGQIYNWHKNVLELQRNIIESQEGIPGLSIKGDKGETGERGNQIHYSGTSITDGQNVININHVEGDLVVTSDGIIYDVVHNGTNLIYSLDGQISGGFFKFPLNNPTIATHSIEGWNATDNSISSNITPYIMIDDKMSYLRVIIGDYKKSTPINSSLTVVNTLEKKTDGSNDLPTDANANTSRPFAQMAFQFRKGFEDEVSPDTTYLKFSVERITQLATSPVFEIINGNANFTVADRAEIKKPTVNPIVSSLVITSPLNWLKTPVIRFFDVDSLIFYKDDNNNYFLEREEYFSTIPTLTFNTNVNLMGNGMILRNLTGFSGLNSGSGYQYQNIYNAIVQDGVLQERGTVLIKRFLGLGTNPLNGIIDNNPIKEVVIGNYDNYFIAGYLGTTDGMYNNDFDGTLQTAFLSRLVMNGSTMHTNITNDLNNIQKLRIVVDADGDFLHLYGRRKTIYVKSWGFRPNPTPQFVNLPIEIVNGTNLFSYNETIQLHDGMVTKQKGVYSSAPEPYFDVQDYTASPLIHRGNQPINKYHCPIFKIVIANFGRIWEVESICQI